MSLVAKTWKRSQKTCTLASHKEEASVSQTIRILLHSLFWLLAAGFYWLLYGRGGNDEITLLYLAIFMPVIALLTYLVNYYLIPRFFIQGRYALFFYLIFCAFIFSAWLQTMSTAGLLYWLAKANITIISPHIRDTMLQKLALLFIPFLFTAIRALRRWVQELRQSQDLQRRRLETELKLKEAELNLLKSQVHPHFLFNTLNNIYGLALDRSQQTAQVVMQLSGLLDYMLYQGNQKYVPLQKELEHIRNYIALEQIRLDDPEQIRIDGPQAEKTWLIAPLLLIPLVENCFKHAGTNKNGEKYIRIKWQSNPDFELMLSNSLATNEAASDKGGIGLDNVRRRLELLYPNRHLLQIRQDENHFTLTLNLELNHDEDDLPDPR